MTEKSFVFDNKRERKIYEFYLNTKGADVNFVFDADTDHPEKVPAHRIILSLDSPVFDTMFFGSIQEQVDIPIVDAPAAAFKEFLQFFYLNEVNLTSANIVHVTNLCKKYEMREFLNPCEAAFKESLTMDDMCWGYSIALLLEQENLSKFCEQTIKSNAVEIIESESFLECDSTFFGKILTLVSSDWSVLDTVIACMEWSKAQCNYNNLEMDAKILRDQLQCVFSQIPFDKLTTQQIGQFVALYKGFFTAQEVEVLIQTSLANQLNPFDFQQPQYNISNLPSGECLDCNRWNDMVATKKSSGHNLSTTIFSSNKTLLLSEFKVYHSGSNYEYSVHEGFPPMLFDKLILKGLSETNSIVLPEKVLIKVGKFYRVNVRYCNTTGLNRKLKGLSNEVELAHDIKITFFPKSPDQMWKIIFMTLQDA